MGYNLTNAKNGKKHVQNIKMAKFGAPIIREWGFMEKMEKAVGEQDLSSKIFYTNPLNFPKIQTVI